MLNDEYYQEKAKKCTLFVGYHSNATTRITPLKAREPYFYVEI
jgi:hypothetical protein